MVVKTKSIYDPKEDGDGLRILITGFYPRGIRKDQFDIWMRELSPNNDLLMEYKKGNYSWNVFREIFLYTVANNIDSLEKIYTLHEQSVDKDITLLCYGKEEDPCYSYLMRDLIETPFLLNDFFESESIDNRETRSIKKLVPF